MLYSNVQQDEIRENITAYMAVDEDARMQNMGTPDNGFHERIVSRDQMFVSKGCKTTFDREALTEEERKLLIFTAPPKFDQKTLPGTMARWHNVLHGRGRFVVFTNDYQTQNVCRLNNIPTICVQHTDEGVPRIDQIFKRMHASGSSRSSVGSDTVVAFINSDLVFT